MQRDAFLSCLALTALMLSACAARSATDAPPISASVNADCAPWDGAAFTLSIPFDTGRLVIISIYRAPDIQRRLTFSFPDPSGRTGHALYQPEFGVDEELSGRVSLDAVHPGLPVEGELDLSTASGVRYHGRFLAIWGEQQAYCG